MNRAKSSLALALFGLLAASGAQAQLVVTQETTLKGIPFQRVHIADSLSQSVQVVWRDDSLKTDPNRLWLRLMAPRSIAEGPAGTTPSSFSETLKDLRSEFRFSIGNTIVQFGAQFRKGSEGEALRRIATVLTNPGLSAENFAIAQKSTKTSLEQEEQNGEALAGKLLFRYLVRDPVQGLALQRYPPLALKGDVEGIRSWMRVRLTRQGMVVATAGPLSVAEIGTALDELLAGLPVESSKAPSPEIRLSPSHGAVFLQKQVAQTVILAGGPGTWTYGADDVLLEIATASLTGGFSSRMYRSLREKLGATYGVRGMDEALSDHARLFMIRSAVDHNRAVYALAGLRAEYAKWHADGITQEELDGVRGQLLSRLAERVREAPAVAGFLALAASNGVSMSSLDDYRKKIEGVSLAEINGFIRTKLPPPPLAIAIVGPSPDGLGAACAIKALQEVSACAE